MRGFVVDVVQSLWTLMIKVYVYALGIFGMADLNG